MTIPHKHLPLIEPENRAVLEQINHRAILKIEKPPRRHQILTEKEQIECCIGRSGINKTFKTCPRCFDALLTAYQGIREVFNDARYVLDAHNLRGELRKRGENELGDDTDTMELGGNDPERGLSGDRTVDDRDSGHDLYSDGAPRVGDEACAAPVAREPGSHRRDPGHAEGTSEGD